MKCHYEGPKEIKKKKKQRNSNGEKRKEKVKENINVSINYEHYIKNPPAKKRMNQ